MGTFDCSPVRASSGAPVDHVDLLYTDAAGGTPGTVLKTHSPASRQTADFSHAFALAAAEEPAGRTFAARSRGPGGTSPLGPADTVPGGGGGGTTGILASMAWHDFGVVPDGAGGFRPLAVADFPLADEEGRGANATLFGMENEDFTVVGVMPGNTSELVYVPAFATSERGLVVVAGPLNALVNPAVVAAAARNSGGPRIRVVSFGDPVVEVEQGGQLGRALLTGTLGEGYAVAYQWRPISATHSEGRLVVSNAAPVTFQFPTPAYAAGEARYVSGQSPDTTAGGPPLVRVAVAGFGSPAQVGDTDADALHAEVRALLAGRTAGAVTVSPPL